MNRNQEILQQRYRLMDVSSKSQLQSQATTLNICQNGYFYSDIYILKDIFLSHYV